MEKIVTPTRCIKCGQQYNGIYTPQSLTPSTYLLTDNVEGRDISGHVCNSCSSRAVMLNAITAYKVGCAAEILENKEHVKTHYENLYSCMLVDELASYPKPKIFSGPFRVGTKQNRAILDSKGLEVAIFEVGAEHLAKLTVEFLNSIK